MPNKIKVFLWRTCSNALPTKVGLHKRKVVDNKTCEQCLKGDEDEVHMVWGCESIHSVWAAPFAAVRLKYPELDTMWDLISAVHVETEELDKFAMVA